MFLKSLNSVKHIVYRFKKLVDFRNLLLRTVGPSPKSFVVIHMFVLFSVFLFSTMSFYSSLCDVTNPDFLIYPFTVGVGPVIL